MTSTTQSGAAQAAPTLNYQQRQQRQQFANLVKTKAKNVVDALQKEVTADPAAIEQRLLARNGLSASYEEMERELRQLQRAKRDLEFDEDIQWSALREQLDDLDVVVEREQSLARAKWNAQIESLKAQMNAELHAIESGKTERARGLTDQLEQREVELTNELLPGADARIEDLSRQIPLARNLYRQLRDEVQRVQNSIEQSRGRLIALVGDASVRAQERLLTCSTLDEARQWLDSIPSVAEMIAIAEDPEQGLKGMVERLTPTHRFSLPQPKEEVPDVAEAQLDEAVETLRGRMSAVDVAFVEE